MEKITLPNGLRILLEPLDHLRTVSFGIWVASGSRYESPENNGISHLIEHMLFKGTSRRSAIQLAEETDEIGGQVNAYTTKEFTCYYSCSLTEHLPACVDLLADMFRHSLFAENELASEKNVVLDEINMSEDDPEDLVVEQLTSAIWKDSPLGQTILGLWETLRSFTSTDLKQYWADRYVADRTVISVCGNFSREPLLTLIREQFADLPSSKTPDPPVVIPYRPSVILTPKAQDQTYLCLALPGLPADHPDRFALSIFNILLGGSSSSRLFQRIREELGLAYSVYSDTLSLLGGGILCIQAAMAPSVAPKVLTEILNVLEDLRKNGISPREFVRAKENLKATVLMGMESAATRVEHNGRHELLFGKYQSAEDFLHEVDSITLERLNSLLPCWLDQTKLSFSAVGSIPKKLEKLILSLSSQE